MMSATWRVLVLVAATAALMAPAETQQRPGVDNSRPAPRPAVEAGGDHVLNAGDRLRIDVLDADEISGRPYQVGEDGKISLPLLGRIQAAGLSVNEFESTLVTELSKYYRDPRVAVTVTELRERPVVLVGAFSYPGTYQLRGRQRLSEIVSSAGGLQEHAQRRLLITRRREAGEIPLPGASFDLKRQVSTAEILLNELMQPAVPGEDLEMKPHDIVTAPRIQSVYVSGEVGRPGEYELGRRNTLPVTRLITLAGGLTTNAMAKKAYILRPTGEAGQNETVPVNVKQIMKGAAEDAGIRPNDVLVIPTSSSKRVFATRMMMVVLPAVVTTAIWVASRR